MESYAGALIELMIFVVVIAFGFQQLWSLRKLKREREERERAGDRTSRRLEPSRVTGRASAPGRCR